MGKLVQCVEWNLSNTMPNKMYCYGEANFEANQAMQEPLEKLYKYENQPDMREKVKKYISELDVEIDRCIKLVEDKMVGLKDSNLIESYTNGVEYTRMESRLQTLTEVKNDLQGRLEDFVLAKRTGR